MKIILLFLILFFVYGLKLKTVLKLNAGEFDDAKELSEASEEVTEELNKLFEEIYEESLKSGEFTAEVPEDFQDDEELVTETEEVDDILDFFEVTTVKESGFYEDYDEAYDILREIDGDEYVVIGGYEFDYYELDKFIDDAAVLYKASMMNEAIEDLEDIISDTSIENLSLEEIEDALLAIDLLLDYMEDDDVVLIDSEIYNHDEILELQTDLLTANETQYEDNNN